jgi:anti-anti-sigma factor
LEPGSEQVVVRLVGELDCRSQFLFQACVEQLLLQGCPSVLFDCAAAEIRDVDALRALVAAHRLFHRAGRQMALAGVSPAIEQILAVVTLHHPILMVEPREEPPSGPVF